MAPLRKYEILITSVSLNKKNVRDYPSLILESTIMKYNNEENPFHGYNGSIFDDILNGRFKFFIEEIKEKEIIKDIHVVHIFKSKTAAKSFHELHPDYECLIPTTNELRGRRIDQIFLHDTHYKYTDEEMREIQSTVIFSTQPIPIQDYEEEQ